MKNAFFENACLVFSAVDFILVWQDSNLSRFRSPPFRLRLCVYFCKASALLQISRFAE